MNSKKAEEYCIKNDHIRYDTVSTSVGYAKKGTDIPLLDYMDTFDAGQATAFSTIKSVFDGTEPEEKITIGSFLGIINKLERDSK